MSNSFQIHSDLAPLKDNRFSGKTACKLLRTKGFTDKWRVFFNKWPWGRNQRFHFTDKKQKKRGTVNGSSYIDPSPGLRISNP
jgi:hypothetical protein